MGVRVAFFDQPGMAKEGRCSPERLIHAPKHALFQPDGRYTRYDRFSEFKYR